MGKDQSKYTRINKTAKATAGIKPWLAADSTPGIERVLFPTFRVDAEDLAAINRCAENDGVTRTVLIRKIIKEFLERRKDNLV